MNRVFTLPSVADKRSAFTLVELLVVIAIIGVMVGLLLPAVQATRENARSVSCQNNLIQLHLATECYYVAFDLFPAGTVTDRLPARLFPDGKDHGWMVQVRPFLDGGTAFADEWSPVHSAYHPRNWPLATMGSEAMACPSNPTIHSSDVVPLCYAGVHDGRDEPIDTSSRGFFVANEFLRRSDVSDGLGHTMQIGEIMVDVGGSFLWISGNQSTLRTTGVALGEMTSEDRHELRDGVPLSVPYARFRDPPLIDFDMVMNSHQASGYSDDLTPSSIADTISQLVREMANTPFQQMSGHRGRVQSTFHPNIGSPPFPVPVMGAKSPQPLGFASNHPGLIHAAFADGRVVSINQAIDAQLYSQIGIRNDQAPLEQPLVVAGP